MKQEDLMKISEIQQDVLCLANQQNELAARQMGFVTRLRKLMEELNVAIYSIRADNEIQMRELQEMRLRMMPPPIPAIVEEPTVEEPASDPVSDPGKAPDPENIPPEPPAVAEPDKVFDLEKFIGENLMSKIGILIILIGVAIFGKYAIDNDLVSPLGRILLGSGLGLAFIGVGLWQKRSVENLSAILVAGGTAVLYLMTYFAYDFYGMIPMVTAGGLMLLISAFTIWSAVFYQKEVIAVYGQLCSYVIPLVISNGTGNLLNFLTYIVIINAVITALAVVYKWRKSYWLSFVISSGIVLWINNEYNAAGELTRLVTLIALNMAIYYVSMAWIKAREGGWLASYDSLMVVIQTLLFFVVGYHQAWIGSGFSGGKLSVVVVTLVANAVLAAWLYSRNDDNCKALGNTAVACVAMAVGYAFFDFFGIRTFIVLWSLMMASMYYFAVRENSVLFRAVSYIGLAAVVISLVVLLIVYDAWSTVVTMLMVATIVTAMLRINARLSGENGNLDQRLFAIVVIFVVWMSLISSVLILGRHCVMLYVVVTLSVLAAANYLFGHVWDWGQGFGTALRSLAVAAEFLAVPTLILMIDSHPNYVTARYVSWAVLAACFYLNNTKALAGKGTYVVGLLTSALAVTSFEVYDYCEERFALSIWWGVFAVACMYAGLARRSKLFRIYGIVILSVTLLKLFFVDLSHLTTMAKVAIFIGLGVLMLIGTYFYQKNNK